MSFAFLILPRHMAL